MLFQIFLIWSSGNPPVQWSETIYAILKEGIMGNIHVKLCEKFGPVVQEEMSFKDISYLELWRPFCYVERKHLCNFGRGYQEEKFCEIILNVDQRFRRCVFKGISYLELWRPLFSGKRNHLCNLVEGIMRNNSVK